MSTIVAVLKNQQVVIAADSLTSFGDTKQAAHYDRWHDKIFAFEDNYLGIVGSAAHHNVLPHLLAEKPKNYRLQDRHSIFDAFLSVHKTMKDRYFLNPKEDDDDDYESSRIDALIINPQGMFGVYSMREVFEYKRFWAIGSGADYALGAMFAVYPHLDDAAAIARCGVEAGAEFDQASALPLSLYQLSLKV